MNCSFCASEKISEVLDFGRVALAGGFLKENGFGSERYFRLRLGFCAECYSLQVMDHVDPNLLFKDYFYSSSTISTLVAHFDHYAAEIVARFLGGTDSSILEIGCNDGVLLTPLSKRNVETIIGVDPATNIIQSIDNSRISIINDYFTEGVSRSVLETYGHIDVVVANNVYAHITDINGVTRAIWNVLGDDGVFIFENHYLPNMISELQYDMIYHEHLYYYSILSLEKHLSRHGFVLFDATVMPTHGGSVRFYASKVNSSHSKQISARLKDLRAAEVKMGLSRLDIYRDFSYRVSRARDELMSLLNEVKSKGFKIAGYGASGRSATMIQFCGINSSHLDYVIDDNPRKIGFYTPGAHFEVVSRDVLSGPDRPDYILVFAWAFIEEISSRCEGFLLTGGRLILPLPKVKII